MEATDLYTSEMVQVKTPSLYKGHFVLVGDAGYAPGPTGTGTSLAITGAYVLAGEMCKYKGDLRAGLRGYEEYVRLICKRFHGLFLPSLRRRRLGGLGFAT
jgi:2-polyprenyl-6-methoxyphenol hydroxylase-like FAD-dependent oxidoreductase